VADQADLNQTYRIKDSLCARTAQIKIYRHTAFTARIGSKAAHFDRTVIGSFASKRRRRSIFDRSRLGFLRLDGSILQRARTSGAA